MTLLALAFVTLQTDAHPVTFRLGPQGEIESWLVAKEPKTPYRAEGSGWRFAYASPKDGLDLGRALGGEKTYGLAGTTLVSDRARRVSLLFGTDDGGTLTLNGKSLWNKTIVRGVVRDEERVDLDLQPGENTLIFRVDQGVGGWGLLARLENGEGITSRVPILAPERDTSRPQRRDYESIRDLVETSARATPLDAEGAVRYDAFRERATLWNARIGKSAALKKEIGSSHAFDPTFRAPYEAVKAAYDAARASSVAAAQNPGPLLRGVKAEVGVRVMPGGRQFVDAKGKAFVPIGYNHNPDWTEFAWANPMNPEGYDPKRADARFAKLQANGVNAVRMMAETPPSGNLEDAVGTFSPEHMTWLDNLVTSARRHNVRIMLTPYDTFWMNLRAEASPYWVVNGGPMDPARKVEWYTAPALRAAHKRRNHWLIDRYGNLDTIFCWEPMNEADIWWDPTPEQLSAWADDVVIDAKAYQKSRWGVERLFSISAATPMPTGGLAEFMFRSPDLDLANTHLYIGAARRAPKDASEVVAPEAEGLRHALGQIRDDRPYIDTENGPIDGWIESGALDDLVFHDQSWSHLASGGAGSGMRWPYRNPHHISDGMLAHLKRMRTFADAVDWTRFGGVVKPLEFQNETVGTITPGAPVSGAPNADVQVANRTLANGTLVATGYATPRGAILFVARTVSSPRKDTVTLPAPSGLPQAPAGSAHGGWKAPRLYDTERGVWLKESPNVPVIVLPVGVRSVCAVWDR